MGLKKFGTGDGKVTEVEGQDTQKTAARRDWTAQDVEELAEENRRTDGKD